MNYSLGFILIQITHSTLATKQPAMTASKVAASMDISGVKEKNMENLVEMLVRLSRSQFVAFAGNIILAFPIGYGIAWIIEYFSGTRFAEETVAQKIIHELHPYHSLALFHAAIAGVYLFLAGLISGYYDNLNLYRKIPKRIKEHPGLQRIISQKKLDSALGIFLIGLINFIVSFGLTTAMAIKSRNVDFKGIRLLINLLFKRFFSRPFDFVWAPKQPRGQLVLQEESSMPLKNQDTRTGDEI